MMMFDNLDFKCYIDYICLYDRLFIVKEAGYKVCEEYSPIAYYWASHNIAKRNVNDTIYYMAHIYTLDDKQRVKQLNSFLHLMFGNFIADIIKNNIKLKRCIIEKLLDYGTDYLIDDEHNQSVLFFDKADEIALNKCRTDKEIETFLIEDFIKKIYIYFSNWEPIIIYHYKGVQKEILSKIKSIDLEIADLNDRIEKLKIEKANLLKT
jgi:hypothetical protein